MYDQILMSFSQCSKDFETMFFLTNYVSLVKFRGGVGLHQPQVSKVYRLEDIKLVQHFSTRAYVNTVVYPGYSRVNCEGVCI